MTLARFAAVIFDMDGVLVDGEPLHFRAVNALLALEGRSLSLEQYKPYMGTKTGWTDMVRDLRLPLPREHYSARYRELVLDEYRKHSEPRPGAVELVRGLRDRGLRTAVCSSSIRDWVDACLSQIGLTGAFDAIVTGDEVGEGKPDPEIYLLAASRLGVAPSACLAFEDAPAGITSARAAGMVCWAVRTDYTRDLHLPDPDRDLQSLTEVGVADILGVAA